MTPDQLQQLLNAVANVQAQILPTGSFADCPHRYNGVRNHQLVDLLQHPRIHIVKAYASKVRRTITRQKITSTRKTMIQPWTMKDHQIAEEMSTFLEFNKTTIQPWTMDDHRIAEEISTLLEIEVITIPPWMMEMTIN